MKKGKAKTQREKENLVGTEKNKERTTDSEKNKCNDKTCHIHGNLKTRGRIFQGIVISKFPKRVTIEFERMFYIIKYERYQRKKTKIHARLPDCMRDKINIGDLIRVQECRPLSKIIHFIVIEKIKDSLKRKEEKK